METALTVLIWLVVGILGLYAFYIAASFLVALLMLVVFTFKERWFR